ncbi:hypothetical protein [Dysgonomonas sp. ZJ709]|uniref:hypothetical protein n=1 Tax=Dysgonomonas sp. ZJ709 TaxID=2709797 RepID=UPI0013EB3405|nr:hypothetical protein [Dysgonomonas sp. ZJ709]
MNNKFKDYYINYDQLNIYDVDYRFIYYFSQIATSKSGVGTRDNPYHVAVSHLNVGNGGGKTCNLLSGGEYLLRLAVSGDGHYRDLIGMGMHATKINFSLISDNFTHIRFKDLTLNALDLVSATQAITYRFDNCVIESGFNKTVTNATRCIVKIQSSIVGTRGTNNTFSNTVIQTLLFTNLSIVNNCDVVVSQADLTSYNTSYKGFDSCRFKIGSELGFTPLIGNTEATLRADFVSRCEAQGLTVPSVTDYDVTNKVGRWVFDNGSTIDGAIIKGSIFHLFEERLFIILGHTINRIERIPITLSKNIPASISTTNPNSGLLVGENSLQLPANVDITDAASGYIESNVMWLGGKNKINEVGIFGNLPMYLGVTSDGTRDIGSTPVTVIRAGWVYLVRSSDKQFASITYNGSTYSTSLTTRNNTFIGVAGVASFAVVSGNVQVFEVLDLARAQTVKMRVVNDLPDGLITSGNLQADYWYFVAPNNLNDTSGTVTYNNVVYPCFGSFLVTSATLTFAITGNCHLRRCWNKNYAESDATDKAFWTNRQKPLWCDVVPNDTRCLMQNNHDFANEMKRGADGNYLTSGHNDFYALAGGDGGVIVPSFTIHGSFVQYRIDISTLNPIRI